MKNTIIASAALLGVTAVAAYLLSFLPQVGVESVVGYASVVTLVGVAGIEYRINWRRLFSW